MVDPPGAPDARPRTLAVLGAEVGVEVRRASRRRPVRDVVGPLVAALVMVAVAASATAQPLEPGVGTLRALGSPSGPGSGEPRLSVAPSGRVLLSWLEQRTAGGHRLRMAWLDGRRWTAATTIAEGDSFFVNWADFPGVRPLDDRRLVAYWPWKVGGDTYAYHVRTTRSPDGGRTWSEPVTLHRDTSATEHGFVSLVSIADTGLAVWLDGRNFQGHADGHGLGPDMTLRSARIAESGVHDEREIDPRVCDCCQTSTVATTRGVLVAYRDRSPEEVRDIALARFENGHWSPPYPLHADGWKIAGCPVNGPALAASGSDVAVAWYTAAGDTPRVHVAFSRDEGRTFAAPVRIDQGEPAGRLAVALLPDRTALVAWLEAAGSATIQMRRVAPSGRMSAPWTVTRTSAARSSGFPQVAVANGRVVVAWTEPAKPSRIRVAIGDLELKSPGPATP